MEDKVKVKVIRRYNDIALDAIQEIGTVLEVTKRRADHLVKEGVAEVVESDESDRKEEEKSEEEETVL